MAFVVLFFNTLYMEKKDASSLILDTLAEKSAIKQKVNANTVQAFKSLKKILKFLIANYRKQLPPELRQGLEFRDRGPFEAEIRVAGDLLIFTMHSNVFSFDRSHQVWKTSYVQKDEMAQYCGIINIYNFLADSFIYNRFDDIGYLIGRIFINKDNHYFVEGKRQLGFLYSDFANAEIDTKILRDIIQSAILYCLNFDLLVPPFENMQNVTVQQMQEKLSMSKIVTGKRMGFKFYADEEVKS